MFEVKKKCSVCFYVMRQKKENMKEKKERKEKKRKKKKNHHAQIHFHKPHIMKHNHIFPYMCTKEALDYIFCVDCAVFPQSFFSKSRPIPTQQSKVQFGFQLQYLFSRKFSLPELGT